MFFLHVCRFPKYCCCLFCISMKRFFISVVFFYPYGNICAIRSKTAAKDEDRVDCLSNKASKEELKCSWFPYLDNEILETVNEISLAF